MFLADFGQNPEGGDSDATYSGGAGRGEFQNRPSLLPALLQSMHIHRQMFAFHFESLALFLTSRWEAYDLLLAIRADKDAPTIARLLVGSAARVVLTRLPQEGSLDPESLRALVAVGQAEVVEDPAAAIESLLARPWSSSRPLVICGSLYLVGWARRWLRARYGRPSSAASV